MHLGKDMLNLSKKILFQSEFYLKLENFRKLLTQEPWLNYGSRGTNNILNILENKANSLENSNFKVTIAKK